MIVSMRTASAKRVRAHHRPANAFGSVLREELRCQHRASTNAQTADKPACQHEWVVWEHLQHAANAEDA